MLDSKANEIQANSKLSAKSGKKGKKTNRQQFKEAKEQVTKVVIKAVWGNNMDNFNTIRSTSRPFNFFYMQVVRLLLLISLICIFGIYFYIYLRSFMFYYNMMALLFTTLAFLFLLIGSGKQVCYQKLVEQGKIKFNDSKKKSNLWIYGLFFYA